MLKEEESGVNQIYIRGGLGDESSKGGRRWSKSRIFKGRIERLKCRREGGVN